MEEAKRLLYEKAIKKFTLQEVAKHKTLPHKNLVELISRYPGYGVGFKVQQKWWPQDTFYHIRKVMLLGPRYGRLYGIKYENGQIAKPKIEKVPDILKRGIWSYQINDPQFTQQSVTLDNNVTFDMGRFHALMDEKRNFIAQRIQMMQYLEPKSPKVVKKKAPVPKQQAAGASKGKTQAKGGAGTDKKQDSGSKKK